MRYQILVILFFGWSASSVSRSWQIKPNHKKPVLQAIFDQATSGDTVIMGPGVYYETELTITKRIIVIGIHQPIIDGKNKGEILTITAAGTSITGLVIQNSGFSGYNDIAAIRILNTRNVTIKNCRLKGNFFAIYCQRSSLCTIEGNSIESNALSELLSANGIHCWKSDSLKIFSNSISGHRDGIYFEFVTASLIQGNTSFKNIRYGLHFMFSPNNMYLNNTFRNNDAGVAVMYSKNVRMFNNLFLDNWGSSSYGLLLKDITDSYIQGNKFNKNTVGIYLEGSNRIVIAKNEFLSNGWAFKIQASCYDNTITKNNFINNSFEVATNGDLVMNKIFKNYWSNYTGYDLNRDGIGDIPHRPVSMYSRIVENNPTALMLFRSVMVDLLDQAEKVIPGFTPEKLKDNAPRMKPLKL
jgi:nitrous oxidase accessory protein